MAVVLITLKGKTLGRFVTRLRVLISAIPARCGMFLALLGHYHCGFHFQPQLPALWRSRKKNKRFCVDATVIGRDLRVAKIYPCPNTAASVNVSSACEILICVLRNERHWSGYSACFFSRLAFLNLPQKMHKNKKKLGCIRKQRETKLHKNEAFQAHIAASFSLFRIRGCWNRQTAMPTAIFSYPIFLFDRSFHCIDSLTLILQ